jgi:hypothetical protein
MKQLKKPLILLLFTLSIATAASAYQQFCRCQCGSSYEISPVEQCGQCTRELCTQRLPNLCSDADLAIDNASATCFQRESLKDRLVVGTFVACTLALLLVAVARPLLQQQQQQQ